MIFWYAAALIVVAVLSAITCASSSLRQQAPNDYTMGLTLLTAIMLLIQIVISVVAPSAGNTASGDPLEFWLYLILAFIMPIGAGFWALIDRTRWANLVLALVHFTVAVMTYRMIVIWQG